MNQSLVMDSDECWCSSTGRLKETNQEKKKLPNAEVVQIKWKVGLDRKKEEDWKFMIEALQTIGEIWWNGGGNLIGRANEPIVEKMKLIKTKSRLFERMVKFNRKKEDNQTERKFVDQCAGEHVFIKQKLLSEEGDCLNQKASGCSEQLG